jgi:hypothetical protein
MGDGFGHLRQRPGRDDGRPKEFPTADPREAMIKRAMPGDMTRERALVARTLSSA